MKPKNSWRASRPKQKRQSDSNNSSDKTQK